MREGIEAPSRESCRISRIFLASASLAIFLAVYGVTLGAHAEQPSRDADKFADGERQTALQLLFLDDNSLSLHPAQEEEEDAGDLVRAYFALGFTGGTILLFGSAYIVRQRVGSWNKAAKTLAAIGYFPLAFALLFWIGIVSIGAAVAVGMAVFLGRLAGVFPPFWWRFFLGAYGVPVAETASKTPITIGGKHYVKGLDFAYRSKLRAAVEEFSQAIESNPKHVDAYLQRGYAYAELSDKGQAIADLQQGLSLSRDPVKNARVKAMIERLRED